MKKISRSFEAEFKFKGDTGTFTGYAAVFGNVDQGGDIVMPGAFKEFDKTRDGKVRVMYRHRDLIGKADVREDAKGLYVEGELLLDDDVARHALVHMKAMTVDAMSFGYEVLPKGAEIRADGVRLLKALRTFEVSVLPFGMNGLARIESVKQLATIREFEDFLRDAGGFSVRQARAIAKDGYKALQTVRDEPGATAQEIADLVSGIRKKYVP